MAAKAKVQPLISKATPKIPAKAHIEIKPGKLNQGKSVGKVVSGKAKTKATEYPALLLTQNKVKFYFATIPVGDLFQYCFVSRRREDNISGFQRELNRSRANDI